MLGSGVEGPKGAQAERPYGIALNCFQDGDPRITTPKKFRVRFRSSSSIWVLGILWRGRAEA